MSEHCPGCCDHRGVRDISVDGSHTCPGIECAACAAKEAEIASLKSDLSNCECSRFQAEIARLTAERQELVESCLQLTKEPDALRALVADMAEYLRLDIELPRPGTKLAELQSEWRRLEGER